MALEDDAKTIDARIDEILAAVKARDPNQPEFYQAVEEVAHNLKPLFLSDSKYLDILWAMTEPERAVQFRVPWINDKGEQIVNRGFRVQFNQAIGPYKGGLRFHPSVNLSIVKFLGFEQVYKNALTTLPMGGGKGGSDFDPKGKSNLEVLRFCKSFMTELSKHIGPDRDVPAGDIGVGGREIGYMFGQYKRLTATQAGVLTGKGMAWGGSNIRPEATGYGLLYITKLAIEGEGETVGGKTVLLSGSGNVAQFAAEKAIEWGMKVLTLSDSGGTILEPAGLTRAQLDQVVKIKTARGRLSEYSSPTGQYFPGGKPWEHAGEVVLPSATQNEINEAEAQLLVANGAQYVAEGANMPTTPEGIEVFKKGTKVYIPAKAANAGGVAVSGLEMSQNSERLTWTRKEVDDKLQTIMKDIYENSRDTAIELGQKGDFQLGANAAGFKKVADAMYEQGIAFSPLTY